MPKQVSNPPNAYILVGSLRSTGYSFEAAVADIVDNSIAAGARYIDLKYPASDQAPYLAILDDGCGMDKDELIVAMRFGSQGTEAVRNPGDLGRFGLGLKLASISQCRKLTVVSKKSNEIHGFCWDIDSIKETSDWSLGELDQSEIDRLPQIDILKTYRSGTLVLWQDFDVLRLANSGVEAQALLDRIHEARKHLALVFHRFIFDQSLTIRMNGRPLPTVDPFLTHHQKTEQLKESFIDIPDEKNVLHKVRVVPYLLPFQKDLTKADYDQLGGNESLYSKQGFYIYRNKRLIIHGSWFGFGRSEELNKYARILVDFPSELDSVWNVDVKKQRAPLPSIVRQKLASVVEGAKSKSRKKTAYRATSIPSNKFSLWLSEVDLRDKKTTYFINRNSPLVSDFASRLDGEDSRMFEVLLESLEDAIPYLKFYNDYGNETLKMDKNDEDKQKDLERCRFLFDMKKKQLGDVDKAIEETFRILNISTEKEWLREQLKNG